MGCCGRLTDRQKAFCDEYLIDLNATQAALRAGYSPKGAQRMAVRNMQNPLVQEYKEETAGSVDTSEESYSTDSSTKLTTG